MNRRLAGFALALLVCAGAQAATISTTLTVTNATGSISTAITFSGPATLTGGIGSGTFSATLSIGASISGPYTITLTSGDKITGTLTVAASSLQPGNPLTGSATVTGGTGAYAGATGSFPTLTGSLSIGVSTTLTFSGAGTITTGGGGGPTGPTGPAGPPAPTITAVQDAASYTKNIAQGSIFVVKGTNMSGTGLTQFGFPLPTSSGASTGNVKITFTPLTGGTGTDSYLVYLYNQSGVNQLAAVLPSTLAAGNYNVTVTNNGTASAPFAATVVQRKIGLITADSSGTGLAVIQNYISAAQLDIDRFTTFASGGYTFSPSRPNQVLIAWATGMGPVTGGDNTASPGFDFTKNGVNVQVVVGGRAITPLYAGRAPGLAGADQINFQLPADVPTGCIVSFQVSVNGALSNPSFIAIAPDANSSTCVQPGFTSAQLQQFDQGNSFTVGAFSLTQITETIPTYGTVKANSAGGQFIRYSGFQLAGLAQYQAQTTTSGACALTHFVSTASSQQTAPVATITGLDAGAVTLNGPAGSGLTNQPFTEDATFNTYSINLGFEGLPISIPGSVNAKLVAGTYTVAGAGGKDVGKFNASVTLGTPLTISNGGLPSVVNRSSGLTVNWTGGNASDLVELFGYAATITGTGSNATSDTWSFICTTTAGAGTITVPSTLLNQMPAVAADAITKGTGAGFLELISGGNSTFTAPLVAGGSIDAGAFLSLVGFGSFAAYQ